MSNDEIRELIQLVVESGIAELELQRGETRVRIRRTLERQEIAMSGPMSSSMPATFVAPGPSSSPTQPTPAQAPAPAANEHIVKSPIVGTYYESPKPGDPPFVKVGDAVEPGQVLCIIESMKLMNEIESDAAGEIVKRFVTNGQPVEYGQSLFAIRPS